eukprot:8764283-Heterocapsa_arctica.AAC.1
MSPLELQSNVAPTDATSHAGCARASTPLQATRRGYEPVASSYARRGGERVFITLMLDIL